LRSNLKERQKVAGYLEHLQMLCYDLYFLVSQQCQRLVNIDREKELSRLLPKLTLEKLRSLLVHLAQARRDVENYVNPLVCFETLWLRYLKEEKTCGILE
jgi:hypothetical protein